MMNERIVLLVTTAFLLLVISVVGGLRPRRLDEEGFDEGEAAATNIYDPGYLYLQAPHFLRTLMLKRGGFENIYKAYASMAPIDAARTPSENTLKARLRAGKDPQYVPLAPAPAPAGDYESLYNSDPLPPAPAPAPAPAAALPPVQVKPLEIPVSKEGLLLHIHPFADVPFRNLAGTTHTVKVNPLLVGVPQAPLALDTSLSQRSEENYILASTVELTPLQPYTIEMWVKRRAQVRSAQAPLSWVRIVLQSDGRNVWLLLNKDIVAGVPLPEEHLADPTSLPFYLPTLIAEYIEEIGPLRIYKRVLNEEELNTNFTVDRSFFLSRVDPSIFQAPTMAGISSPGLIYHLDPASDPSLQNLGTRNPPVLTTIGQGISVENGLIAVPPTLEGPILSTDIPVVSLAKGPFTAEAWVYLTYVQRMVRLAVRHTGRAVYVYVNDVCVYDMPAPTIKAKDEKQLAAAGNIRIENLPMEVTGFVGVGTQFLGALRLYQRALTEEELAENYRVSRKAYGGVVVSTPLV